MNAIHDFRVNKLKLKIHLTCVLNFLKYPNNLRAIDHLNLGFFFLSADRIFLESFNFVVLYQHLTTICAPTRYRMMATTIHYSFLRIFEYPSLVGIQPFMKYYLLLHHHQKEILPKTLVK